MSGFREYKTQVDEVKNWSNPSSDPVSDLLEYKTLLERNQSPAIFDGPLTDVGSLSGITIPIDSSAARTDDPAGRSVTPGFCPRHGPMTKGGFCRKCSR